MLPVENILPELRQALLRGNAVLGSPPGSGKTTRVPLALLDEPWLQGKKIIMLEPRRPAARMAAHYMAGLLDEPVGQRVGYQVRMDRKISGQTRIEVLTEGLLVKRLQSDPELSDTGLVIFDEFHEQSLQSELGLALCLDVCQALRDDLRLLIMSATLDEQAVADLVDGSVVTSDGGLFSVDVRYLEKASASPVLSVVSKLVFQACEESAGDVLVFLPGKAEIAQLGSRLLADALPLAVVELHGEMDANTQAKVLQPQKDHTRRVVLTTDVAETSLTIKGITAVVDTGLTRKPVFDPNSGLSRLQTFPVARASAEQRAGRAGRLQPGICYRAWTEHQHRERPYQRPPEIHTADLTAVVLELAQWGVTDPRQMKWLNPPPAAAWNQGVDLLQKLDALDKDQRITPHGGQLVKLGLHPRLAHLLVWGGKANRQAADLAAILSDRDPWRAKPFERRPADLGLRLYAMESLRQNRQLDYAQLDKRSLRHLLKLSDRLARMNKTFSAMKSPISAAGLLSLAFPERIARQRQGGKGSYLMASGKAAALPGDDSLVTAEYLAIAHMDAGSREGKIWLAMELSEQELQDLHAEHIREHEQLSWDEQHDRVVLRQIRSLGALPLSVRELPAKGEHVTGLLLQTIAEKGLDVLPWSRRSGQLLARLRLAAHLDAGGGWPLMQEDILLSDLENWLAPWIEGMRSLRDLQKLDMLAVVQSLLDWEKRQQLDQLLPRRWKLGDGNSAAIDYSSSPPLLAVPLQSMYGEQVSPMVFRGRQPLLLHLLSPAGRPLQVTMDLENFWDNAWLEVKKEMRGRYPRHHWPDDPRNASPVRLKRNL
jgi:ATP-dependent helicase HrpB